MNIINFYDWQLITDREATRNAYSILAETDKKCTCSACQNFWQVGKVIFPPDVIKLFELLGVTWRFPVEIHHNCQLSPGKHNYGGWYHFVGSFKGEESNKRIPTKMKRLEFTPWPKITTIESYNIRLKSVNEDFQIGFSNRLACVSSAFKGLDIVQCDFNVNNVPWELAEEEPT